MDDDLLLDVSNDAEVERLGANAAALYSQEFWETLCRAARADGRRLDGPFDFSDNDDGCYYTKKIPLTATPEQDDRLYKRFRSNFGMGMNLEHIQASSTCNPLVSERWAALLTATEGLVDDYNFMTLLRADCRDMFWMTETDVSEGLLVVPRAQFLFIELARSRQGLYGRAFRQALQVFDVKTASERLEAALDNKNSAAALQALHLLHTQWPYPRMETLQTTGVVRVLKQADVVVMERCQLLLQKWRDLHELSRIELEDVHQTEALQRAARSLAVETLSKDKDSSSVASTTATIQQQSPVSSSASSSFLSNGHHASPPSHTRAVATKTTTSVKELTVDSGADASNVFDQYGLAIFPDLIPSESVASLLQQAALALQDLITEQLTPRGLTVDGDESFDFAEVRQRPGHRVDNRYHILEPEDSPIARLGRILLQELPKRLFQEDDSSQWKLLYAGVVHSFPRKTAEDPLPDAQIWHRDGGSLFTDQHHPTHSFNVFVPLINVSRENGATEFVTGTHDDVSYEDVAADVILTAQRDPQAQHELAVSPTVAAGTAICFDIRVLHRGLANASLEERPVLYFTLGRDFFQERHMFQEQSILQQQPPADATLAANRALCQQLYRTIAGRAPPISEDQYGHPHYTTRFDLLLLERFQSNDVKEQAEATNNVSAILSFAALSAGDKDALCRDFVFALTNEDTVERKMKTLELQRERRIRAREQRESDDFASMSTDLSDVAALYKLVARIVIKETTLLSKLGFTVNELGLCVLLSMLKLHATYSGLDGVGVSPAQLEEAWSSFWNAGKGRFEFLEGRAKTQEERSKRVLLVLFSSLGTGIARPEWKGSVRNLLAEHSDDLDCIHVMDPAFSWYCQDEECQWTGGDYYATELGKRTAGYRGVFYLGDSMGAAAALRFSKFADKVLAFTPQVDVSQYEAITRADFALSVKKEFQRDLVAAAKNSKANITVHYGEHCDEDVRQVGLLPQRDGIELIPHDYDDHVLSLHLRDQGLLTDLVEASINAFLYERK